MTIAKIDRRELKDAHRAFANFEYAWDNTLAQTTYDEGIEAWTEMQEAYEQISHVRPTLRKALEAELGLEYGAGAALALMWEIVDNCYDIH